MKRNVHGMASVVSLLVFGAMLVLWPVSYHLDDRTDGLRLIRNVRVGVFDGSLSIYNQVYPYNGGIIAITAAGSAPPKWPKTNGFDFAGLYYRHFTWPGQFPGGTYWTLRVPLFYALVLSAVLPATWATLRRAKLAGGRTCRRCGYDLRATPDRCPECGHVPEKVTA